MNKTALQPVADMLVKEAGAVFVFAADHIKEEGVFDVIYYSQNSLDDYNLRLLEYKIETFIGKETELNNLKDCDTVFVAELLRDAQLIYCGDEREKNRFLASAAQKAELMHLQREVMITRIRECGVAYEN